MDYVWKKVMVWETVRVPKEANDIECGTALIEFLYEQGSWPGSSSEMDPDSNEYEYNYQVRHRMIIPDVKYFAEPISILVEEFCNEDDLCNTSKRNDVNCLRDALTERVRKAINSCDGDPTKMKWCPKCKLPLLVGSMNWEEGVHIDSCK